MGPARCFSDRRVASLEGRKASPGGTVRRRYMVVAVALVTFGWAHLLVDGPASRAPVIPYSRWPRRCLGSSTAPVRPGRHSNRRPSSSLAATGMFSCRASPGTRGARHRPKVTGPERQTRARPIVRPGPSPALRRTSLTMPVETPSGPLFSVAVIGSTAIRLPKAVVDAGGVPSGLHLPRPSKSGGPLGVRAPSNS